MFLDPKQRTSAIGLGCRFSPARSGPDRRGAPPVLWWGS
jgi:hypothetical protein